MNIKMKRHESFSIREGWLAKGIQTIKSDNKIFSSPNATDVLGIGTNMVKSLKYWMFATGLTQEQSRNISLSEMGNLIDEYDSYLEDIFSWWMIHINLILNVEEAYIFNSFFNKCNAKTFSKKDIFEQILYDLTSKNIKFNEKILQDEVNMVIKTYAIEDKMDNPENNFVCPLTELNLLKKCGRDTFEKIRPSYKKLNYLLVYYLIQLLVGNNEGISIDDLIKLDNSPAKIFNLDKNLINEYLDEMKRNGLITINRTAGLNMVYINEFLTLKDIFKEYFE
ncbi:MAG: DUF4007 family protein [Clostridia bacterium]|nr:DUF4007 family protein [Clostridia bacterium]